MRSPYVRQYHSKRLKRILISIVLIAIILFLAIYSVSLSSYPLTFEEAYETLHTYLTGGKFSGYHQHILKYIVVDVNLPRTVLAIFIGAVLAICGAIMQSLTHNPLTDPYTMGISSAALFGVTISIVYGFSILPFLYGDQATIANAFVFAMIPSMLIIFISKFKTMGPTMMVLIGIGVMYLFNAFSTFIKINADAEKLSEIYTWSVGTLNKVTPEMEIPSIGIFIILLIFSLLIAKKLNVVAAGDRVALVLGENPVLIRIMCFLIISLSVAVCVSFSGTIGFVGLVAPHIARLFTGNNNRILLPASAIIGALMLLVSDCVIRYYALALPVGVITAIIGSPLFIIFLYRQGKKSDF